MVLQFLDDGRASVGASEATSGPAGAADLNLRTLEERVAQSALKKEKGESYVRDTYRLRLKENPADPVGMYLYARVATAEEKASLATQCTEQYPDYAWCWFLARHCAEESGDWETALQHVERAASLFEATEIVEARDRLRAARADWYDEWTGRRSATVRFELTSTKVRIQVEEMGKGFGCPVLCSKPDEFATLCYSVTWVHSGQSMEFDVKSLKCILDDGSQREAELVGSDKRVLEGRRHGQGGTAIAVVCVPRGRIVRSVFYWPAAYSMGGVLGEW
ncbi:MAG: hypothetical protein JW940_10150 [Polyangiaceae bacterium]|nr:hypothetical protein [Polyangiaceae bacterium]